MKIEIDKLSSLQRAKKKYYNKNKDEIKAKVKEYRKKNKEKIRQKAKEYYFRNRDKLLQQRKDRKKNLKCNNKKNAKIESISE